MKQMNLNKGCLQIDRGDRLGGGKSGEGWYESLVDR